MQLFSDFLKTAANLPMAFADFLERLLPSGMFVISLFISLLMALLSLLICYAVYLRFSVQLQIKHRKTQFALWNRLVPAYLAEEAGSSQIIELIRRSDMQLFGDYCRPILLDVEGDDQTRLLDLLEELHYGAYLMKLMDHRQTWRRTFAIHYLGLIRYAPALPLVRQQLHDHSELVQYVAAQALMRMRDTSQISFVLQQLGKTAFDKQDRISAILFEFGPDILPELLRILREGRLDNWVVTIIIRVFRHHSYTEATWDLAQLAMTTPHKEIRLAALGALAEAEEPMLVAMFEDLAAGDDPVVCAVAARALGKIGGPEHLKLLLGLLHHNDFWVLKEAIGSAIQMGEPGLNALRKQVEGGALSARALSLVREALSDAA